MLPGFLIASLLAAPPIPAAPAPAPARYGFLAHLGVGGYSLSVSDASGAASSRALLAGGGAVATRSLSPAFGLGALAELSDFLPDNSGSSALLGFLIGPAAVFRTGGLALAGGAALSALSGGNGLGLGLLAAGDVVLAGPFSLHGQLTYRNAFPSGGRVSLLAGEVGLGLVY